MDKNPSFTLAKTCDKNRHAVSLPFLAGSSPFKMKFINISLSLRILPAQLSLCVPRSKLLIGMCCACAVFGVCADDDFLRNESTWVLFLDVLPILASAQLQNCKQVAFRLYFIQSEKPTVNLRLESDFPLSVLKCLERSILPGKKNFQKSHLQGALSLKSLCPGKQVVDRQLLPPKIIKSSWSDLGLLLCVWLQWKWVLFFGFHNDIIKTSPVYRSLLLQKLLGFFFLRLSKLLKYLNPWNIWFSQVLSSLINFAFKHY